MPDREALLAAAEQLMSGAKVVVEGRSSRVTRTGSQRLRTAKFITAGREYQAIEQNPEEPSRWGRMAQQGKQVVQFRDLQTNKYIAVAVDGKLFEYGQRGE
jgi:hypothetical protein